MSLDELLAVSAGGKSTTAIGVAACRSQPKASRPRIMLVVSGADRLVLHGEASTSPLLAPLLALLAESGGADVQIVLAGLPNILNHRLGMNTERRLVLHPGEPDAVLGVPRALLTELGSPGRAVDTETGTLLHLAGELTAVYPAHSLARPPHQFREVPRPLGWADAPESIPGG
ncbi:MAG: hypothetical protein GY745_02000 [Actinomycetia bacterium]|nr:hypothetical protein [Actinomycetes bacterium]